MQYFSNFYTILQFWHLQSETYPIKSVKSIGPIWPPKTITLSPKEMDDAWSRPKTVLQVSSDCHSFVSKLYNSTEHYFKYFLLLLLVLKLHLTFLVKFMFGKVPPAKCKDLIIVGWQNSSPVDKPGILDRAKNLKTKFLKAIQSIKRSKIPWFKSCFLKPISNTMLWPCCTFSCPLLRKTKKNFIIYDSCYAFNFEI